MRVAQQWGIPTAEARQWFKNAERIDSDQLHRYGELLRFSVNQTTDGERRRDELGILTDNLDDTYEELHLIYEVSHVLGIPQRPHEMLTNVCKQLLEVTRAESVAFVLNGYEYEDIESLVRASGDQRVLSEHDPARNRFVHITAARFDAGLNLTLNHAQVLFHCIDLRLNRVHLVGR